MSMRMLAEYNDSDCCGGVMVVVSHAFSHERFS